MSGWRNRIPCILIISSRITPDDMTRRVMSIWGWRWPYLFSSPSPPLVSLHCADTYQKDFCLIPDSPLHLHHQMLLSKASTRSQSQDPMTCKSVPLISLWRDAEWSGEVSCPLTSAPHPTRPSLSADCGLCLSLINEMYDNVISLIEWHSLMVLCDYD